LNDQHKSKPEITYIQGSWRELVHTNWFVPISLWLLTQAIIFVGFMFSMYQRMGSLTEWRGATDITLKRMDESGTFHGRYRDEQEDKDIADLQARMKLQENEGRHWEVIETEHRRLTQDVEELRHGKK
jgi:hypothetical protein